MRCELRTKKACSPQIREVGNIPGYVQINNLITIQTISRIATRCNPRDRKSLRTHLTRKVRNVGMNPTSLLKEPTTWMVYKGHSNSHSLLEHRQVLAAPVGRWFFAVMLTPYSSTNQFMNEGVLFPGVSGYLSLLEGNTPLLINWG